MATIRSDIGSLVGAFLGLGIWGFYVCLFIVAIWTARRHAATSLQRPVMAAIVSLFLLNIVTTVTTVMKCYDAFIRSVGGPQEYFNDFHNCKYRFVEDVVLILATIIADSLITFRLFIVWDRARLVLVVPVLALIAILIIGVMMIVCHALLVTRGLSSSYYYALYTALFAVTMVNNWLMTAMIVGRLKWAERRMRTTVSSFSTVDQKRYRGVIDVLVDSAALYSLVLGAIMFSCAVGSETVPRLLEDTLPRVIGIVPTLIVLQRSMGHSQSSEATAGVVPSTTSMRVSTINGTRSANSTRPRMSGHPYTADTESSGSMDEKEADLFDTDSAVLPPSHRL